MATQMHQAAPKGWEFAYTAVSDEEMAMFHDWDVSEVVEDLLEAAASMQAAQRAEAA